MTIKRAIRTIRALTVLAVACLSLLAPRAVLAQEEVEIERIVRTEDPGFRTDVGVHLAFGGHSCVGGGSEYAECKGADTSWDTSWGLAGGLIVRPFNRFSAGIDVIFVNMVHHQDTASKWSDFMLGPVVRYHQPVRIRELYFEPSLGIQAGWVQAKYHQATRIDTNEKVDYDHKHLGAFLAIPIGLDFFPLPKLGVGLEFRLLRTFYSEVCFEWRAGVNCRGTKDEAIVKRFEDDKVTFPGEKGVASYPWKLFWGVHALYYF
ncbi:MAG: hypothetical protein JRF63_03655 [Deltaproteobacteria bacterium]|nr:hypothetical protein [Deltaproteobacteria bacterium]